MCYISYVLYDFVSAVGCELTRVRFHTPENGGARFMSPNAKACAFIAGCAKACACAPFPCRRIRSPRPTPHVYRRRRSPAWQPRPPSRFGGVGGGCMKRSIAHVTHATASAAPRSAIFFLWGGGGAVRSASSRFGPNFTRPRTRPRTGARARGV